MSLRVSKSPTIEKRGTGTRRKVWRQTKLPANFPDVSRDPMTKTELFEFLTEVVATRDYPAGKEVYLNWTFFTLFIIDDTIFHVNIIS